jgi:predicted Zn-dependent protease
MSPAADAADVDRKDRYFCPSCQEAFFDPGGP